jgi:hypothetical protein
VRDAERLVQVQVADVGADVAGAAEADLGVHVGAVHVHLAAVLVHDPADLADGGFEHPVGGGVGHHQAGEGVPVLQRLGAQVDDVHVALGIGGDRDDLQSGHHGAGRVGAMCRHRDQAGAPVPVAVVLMVLPDHQQAGELALTSRVGLHGHLCKPCDLGQCGLQLVEQLLIALGLRARREGMQPVELAPAHRHHLGGGVQLHGAGAQRDHGRGERQVLDLEPLEVAQHLGLAVAAMEYWVGQERRAAAEGLRNRRLGVDAGVAQHVGQGDVEGKDRDQVRQIGDRDGFIQCDCDTAVADHPQIDLPGAGGVEDARQIGGLDLDTDGVEEVIVHQVIPQPAKGGSEHRRLHVDPLGGAPDPVGPKPARTHAPVRPGMRPATTP